MENKEKSENQKRVEKILLVRKCRGKLGSFSERFLTKEEKAMSLKALDDYEFWLNANIQKSKHVASELESQGISHSIDLVEVPQDLERPTYEEFRNAGDYESLEGNIIRVKDVIDKIPSLGFEEDELKVFLEALKEYCLRLEGLKQERKRVRETYGEEYQRVNDAYKIPEEIQRVRPTTPTMTQNEMRNELFSMLANATGEESKRK